MTTAATEKLALHGGPRTITTPFEHYNPIGWDHLPTL